ncbi:MAG: hypothetical protein QM503_10905 [Bacteroidota bacterium]
MIKRLLIVMLVTISVISCNSGDEKNKKEDNIGFVATIDSTMTLAQVAKANNIGEPYLRTELGIRRNVGNSYTVVEMAKRFKFSLDDLRKVIEDRKNKQAASQKRKMEAKEKK